jgi:hypothetical protein
MPSASPHSNVPADDRLNWLPTWPRLTAPDALRPAIGVARHSPPPSRAARPANDHPVKAAPASRAD